MVDDWQAMTKWTMPFLSENFGDQVIEIQENREKDPDYALKVPEGRRRPMVERAFENYERSRKKT